MDKFPKEFVDWITSWTYNTSDTPYGQGYIDAMIDILNEIKEYDNNS